jgi:hypothetical protein
LSCPKPNFSKIALVTGLLQKQALWNSTFGYRSLNTRHMLFSPYNIFW